MNSIPCCRLFCFPMLCIGTSIKAKKKKKNLQRNCVSNSEPSGATFTLASGACTHPWNLLRDAVG